MFLFSFTVSPLASLLSFRGKQKFDLLMQIALIILISVSLWIGSQSNDPKIVSFYYVTAYCIKYSIELLIAKKIAYNSI